MLQLHCDPEFQTRNILLLIRTVAVNVMPSFVPSKTKYMLLPFNLLTGLIDYLWIGGFKFGVLCMVFIFGSPVIPVQLYCEQY